MNAVYIGDDISYPVIFWENFAQIRISEAEPIRISSWFMSWLMVALPFVCSFQRGSETFIGGSNGANVIHGGLGKPRFCFFLGILRYLKLVGLNTKPGGWVNKNKVGVGQQKQVTSYNSMNWFSKKTHILRDARSFATNPGWMQQKEKHFSPPPKWTLSFSTVKLLNWELRGEWFFLASQGLFWCRELCVTFCSSCLFLTGWRSCCFFWNLENYGNLRMVILLISGVHQLRLVVYRIITGFDKSQVVVLFGISAINSSRSQVIGWWRYHRFVSDIVLLHPTLVIFFGSKDRWYWDPRIVKSQGVPLLWHQVRRQHPPWEWSHSLFQKRRFWVNDVPNFPFGGICDRFLEGMCWSIYLQMDVTNHWSLKFQLLEHPPQNMVDPTVFVGPKKNKSHISASSPLLGKETTWNYYQLVTFQISLISPRQLGFEEFFRNFFSKRVM